MNRDSLVIFQGRAGNAGHYARTPVAGLDNLPCKLTTLLAGVIFVEVCYRTAGSQPSCGL
jgi:hypothetical protein